MERQNFNAFHYFILNIYKLIKFAISLGKSVTTNTHHTQFHNVMETDDNII